MTTSALLLMIGWMGGVTMITAYLFYKVLTIKQPKRSEDKETGNAAKNRLTDKFCVITVSL